MSAAQFYDQNGELRMDGSLVGGGGAQPFSGVSVGKNVSQTALPTRTLTPVTWQVEDYDTDSYHAANSANFTIPTTGKYLCECGLYGLDDSSVSGTVLLQLNVNGSIARTCETLYDGNFSEFSFGRGWVLALTAADVVRFDGNYIDNNGAGTTWQIGPEIQTHAAVTKLG